MIKQLGASRRHNTETDQGEEMEDEGMEGPSRGSSFLSVTTREEPQEQNSVSAISIKVQSLTAEEMLAADKLRRLIRFHFMNPHEKWKVRRQFPWRLSLQLLKIIVVTLQLYLFGTLRIDHVTYISEVNTAMKHLFVLNWTSASDITVYPPVGAPFAVFTQSGFLNVLGFAVEQYYRLENISVARFHKLNKRDPDFYGSYYKEAKVTLSDDETLLYNFDTNLVKRDFNLSKCRDMFIDPNNTIPVALKMDHCLRMRLGLDPLFPGTLVNLRLNFTLFTVHVSPMNEATAVSCYRIENFFSMTAKEHSGEIFVALDTEVEEMGNKICKGQLTNDKSPWAIIMDILDFFVMFVCVGSLILCIRAIINGHLLAKKTRRFFRQYLDADLDFSDRKEFYNLWFFLMTVNDFLVIIGTFFKMSVDYGSFNQNLFTATTMLLGIGTLLVWTGVLRYLGFFSHYNVLIVTLKKALPNVGRFMVCAGMLYFGFMLCGWIVLGPYSIKFKTALGTSECLFALINGDDMFATFFTITGSENSAIKWFARVYLYVFISTFIYVVLSLFISIIMDAYEVIKNEYNEHKVEPTSKLHDFIKDCVDTPRPGNYERTEGILDAIWDSNCLRWLRNLHPFGRGTSPPPANRSDYEEIEPNTSRLH